MAEVGIRQWLKDNGYASNDDDITYDNGTVKLKGTAFYNAKPASDGSTYADPSNLANAYKAYTQNGYMNQVNNFLNTASQRINQPVKQFDANNDAQYKSMLSTALANAQKNAQTASNNAMVGLGSRGIGNSSVAVDRANQIQQQAYSNVSQNLEPTYLAQAYDRYIKGQEMERLQTQDLIGLAGTYNNLYQQGLDNDYRNNTFNEQVKQNNLDLAKWGVQTYGYGDPKSDAGVFFNQYNGAKTLAQQQMDTQNNQWQTQFDYGKERDTVGDNQWLKTFNANQANVAADNSRQWASLGLQKDQVAWSKDPNNPDNMYKLAQIENLKADNDRLSSTSSKTNPNSYISNLNKMYTTTDPISKKVAVNNPDALERAILALNLPADQTKYLYEYYGLKIPE